MSSSTACAFSQNATLVRKYVIGVMAAPPALAISRLSNSNLAASSVHCTSMAHYPGADMVGRWVAVESPVASAATTQTTQLATTKLREQFIEWTFDEGFDRQVLLPSAARILVQHRQAAANRIGIIRTITTSLVPNRLLCCVL